MSWIRVVAEYAISLMASFRDHLIEGLDPRHGVTVIVTLFGPAQLILRTILRGEHV
jgi:hypothetical protein